jgi:MoaA/NifB/PqqE/SkfB family radical SAM enzyme
VQPWLSKEISVNKTEVCCWLPTNHDLEQIRHDLLNNVQSPDCAKCWRAEANGEQSRRLQQNILADTLYDLSIDNIQTICEQDGYNPTIYQITTSNVCNGACIMCVPQASSKWQSLVKDFNKQEIDKVDINFDTAKYVEFIGGEPLLEPKNIEILKKLNTNCVISFVTNGSIEIKQELLDLLSEFNELIICLSIDGIGPVYEYQRWPLKWNILLENLSKFKKLGCELSVSYTLTNVNLPYKQETIDWFNEQGLDYIINEVSIPECFNPNTPISKKTIQELDRQDALKGIDRRDYGFNF